MTGRKTAMSEQKKITINAIGSIVSMLGQWLISVLLVRMGGYADAGVFSLAMSMSNVFNVIANYGIRNYQVSDARRDFSQRQYLWARTAAIALSFAVCGVYLLASAGYSSGERLAIGLYLVYSNINIFGDTLLGTLQLHGMLQLNGYSSIIKGVVCFVVFCLSYLAWHSLPVSLGMMAAAIAAVTVLYDWRLYRQVEPGRIWPVRGDCQAVLHLGRRCLGLMVASLLPLVTTALPRRAIQLVLGAEQLGYFSSIFTPTVLVTTLVPTVLVAILPRLRRAWANRSWRAMGHWTAVCYAGVAVITLLAELAALVVGRPVMSLVFGDEILQHYPLLYWAILATGLNAATLCGNSILTAMRRSLPVAVTSGTALVLTAVLSEPFTRMFGITGAAYVLIAAYAGQALAQGAVIVWTVFRAQHSERGAEA